MNESFVTVVGNVVADPIARPTKTGKPFASFRVASTTRRWDGEQRAFVDGSTNFVNVVAFNSLGAHVMGSLHKGHPVIVYGRLRVNQWATEKGENRTTVEIDAYSVGHDLTRGQTTFFRPERAQFDPNDRLADPNIQSSLQAHEAHEANEANEAHEADDEELDELLVDESTGEVLERAAQPVELGFGRTPEDADTDEYVVEAV